MEKEFSLICFRRIVSCQFVFFTVIFFVVNFCLYLDLLSFQKRRKIHIDLFFHNYVV